MKYIQQKYVNHFKNNYKKSICILHGKPKGIDAWGLST